MNSEFLIGSIEELFSENSSEICNRTLSIIEEGRDIDRSFEIDIIREITDFLVAIDIDHLTRE